MLSVDGNLNIIINYMYPHNDWFYWFIIALCFLNLYHIYNDMLICCLEDVGFMILIYYPNVTDSIDVLLFFCEVIEDWLIIYCFTSRSRIFHLYGDVTIADEGLQNLGLCSALRPFEQGGIFIVPHLLWHGTSVFPVSSEGQPQSVAFYDTHGDAEDLF
jgi:hypothetical protein